MYKINKGVDRPPEVLGIRGMQYLTFLGAGVVCMLILTAIIIGLTGITPLYGFGVFLALVMILYTQLVNYSKKYGERGLNRFNAQKKMPDVITVRDSTVYKALRSRSTR